jgi:1-deoxy-D-xylulose-5-phosphate reductoisomerase
VQSVDVRLPLAHRQVDVHRLSLDVGDEPLREPGRGPADQCAAVVHPGSLADGGYVDNGVMTAPEPQRRDVVVLGSTGSIGTQALDIVRSHPERFRVVALTAGGSNRELFDAQVAEFAPAFSGLGADASAEAAARQCDVVLNGITGAVGLSATLATLDAGNTLALANKESLIMGGPLVLERAKPGQIVPVDSEHSALAQCLRGGTAEEVRRLVLTASGGPFRGRSRDQLLEVSLAQALAHPTWDMGPVVTINSATLVNKGLEVIEAHLLFGIPYDRIEVVVHPTSVVHSMVEFVDGSTLAQASPPTMLIPIALGLAWPDRVPGIAPPVDWTRVTSWEFFPLDDEAFPAVRLAREAGLIGATAPAVYNAANEVAVEAFRQGRLGFVEIIDTVAHVLGSHDVPSSPVLALDDVLAADAWARDEAARQIERTR